MDRFRPHQWRTNWLGRLVLCWAAVTLGLWLFGDLSFFDSYVIGGLVALSAGLVVLAIVFAVWLVLAAAVDLLGR